MAIVFHWLVQMRGGERVLERMLDLFPNADIFTHVYRPERISPKIRARNVRTTFINRLPAADRHYQKYLPLMPHALEELDLRGYDLVISNEAGPTKGVIAAPDALHVCYAHSPMRYLWDHYHEYRASAGVLSRAAMSLTFPALRRWDVTSAARVDRIMANSRFVSQRIEKYWRRSAEVVHPPVSVADFRPSPDASGRYLWVSQMTRYKRPDLAVEAFNRTGLPLLMVGDGEMHDEIRRKAGPNIEVIRRLNFDGLRDAYAKARGLVFTAEEDFGIVPVEAMASGRPVLALGRGGALDTVSPGVSGLFYDAQDVEALEAGIERFEQWLPSFDPSAAVAHAAKFAPEVFDRRFCEVILAS
ncbi:glycosyltransferase [Croceicoccus bisphenolivorans]|uniref:glycosyltransferase n=1 Tax=Croceicoccus bisphenolivorans TaxID=1783232 RepID=UPI001FE06689|nr:glycosyltransferase [Croceicoccus bisphenolivorans]